MYGCEAWAINENLWKRVDMLKMKWKTICGVRKMVNGVSNILVRDRCLKKRSMVKRAEEGVVKWFGHMERIEYGEIHKEDVCCRNGGGGGVKEKDETKLELDGWSKKGFE